MEFGGRDGDAVVVVGGCEDFFGGGGVQRFLPKVVVGEVGSVQEAVLLFEGIDEL